MTYSGIGALFARSPAIRPADKGRVSGAVKMIKRLMPSAALFLAMANAALAGPAIAAIEDPYDGDVVSCIRRAEDAMDRLGITVTLRYPAAINGETANVSYFVTCSVPGYVVFSVASTLNSATTIRLLNQFRAAF